MASALQTPVREVLQSVLDIVFPPRCAICRTGGQILCATCLAQLQPARQPRCSHCCALLTSDGCCSACSSHVLRIDSLHAFSGYQGLLRSCIHALKYDGNSRLAKPLGTILAQTYQTQRLQADILLPVPLHAQRYKERGYNHALLLARVCAQQLGISLQEGLLVRHRSTAAQVGLGPQERHKNVADAFSCPSIHATRILSQRRIIVIDDVCTTGATLEACAQVLYAAGVHSVQGLVLARSYKATE